jgi:hypothetical protein
MRKPVGLWVVAALAAATLSGCSAESANPIIEIKLSKKWFEVSSESLNGVESSWSSSRVSAEMDVKTLSQQAWSLSPNTSATDLFSNYAPQRLQAYVQTRFLQPQELNAIDLSSQALQDVVVSVSSRTAGDGLEVRKNNVSESNGVLSLDQELAWDYAGVTQTIFVRAAADLSSRVLTIFWLRCSDTCVAEESATISNVFSKLSINDGS